jgi:hypothetical protein
MRSAKREKIACEKSPNGKQEYMIRFRSFSAGQARMPINIIEAVIFD